MKSGTLNRTEYRRVHSNNGALTVTIAKVIADNANIIRGTVVEQELQTDGSVLLRAITKKKVVGENDNQGDGGLPYRARAGDTNE